MNVKHLAARPGLSWCTMSDLICLKVKIKSSPRLSLACRGQWQLPILIYCDKLLSFSHTWEKQMQHWKQAKRAALATAWLKVQRLVFSERSPHPRPRTSFSISPALSTWREFRYRSAAPFILLQISMQYVIHTHMGAFRIYICNSFFQGSVWGREGCPVALAMFGNCEWWEEIVSRGKYLDSTASGPFLCWFLRQPLHEQVWTVG